LLLQPVAWQNHSGVLQQLQHRQCASLLCLPLHAVVSLLLLLLLLLLLHHLPLSQGLQLGLGVHQ
jgi:hypothetical protein